MYSYFNATFPDTGSQGRRLNDSRARNSNYEPFASDLVRFPSVKEGFHYY